MIKQLNIRSDEAYSLAHKIADNLGKPVGEAVLIALRDYGSRLPKVEDMTPTQRAEYEALMALAKEAAKHKRPGATSDHSDMYDEKGLPI
jgi:hypothetical protein